MERETSKLSWLKTLMNFEYCSVKKKAVQYVLNLKRRLRWRVWCSILFYHKIIWMFSLMWRYFCLQVSSCLHHWYYLIFFFLKELSILKRQQLCKISAEWEFRDCESCPGINLSHKNIWMWGRVDIILPMAGEHKCKTTVQLVRITTHEYPWVDIYYKTLLCLELPMPVGRHQKMLWFETMLMVFAIL